ncbi:hypothetical protein [Microbispora rosea]
MTTVFGDFLREASEQMNTAVYCAERSISGVAAIATIEPARRMTTVLLRYLDDLAPERAPAHERLSHLWDRVNHPRVLLQEAEVILHDLDRQLAGRSRNTAHPVPVHVASAALALGTGHDLLKTHYKPRSDWANAIEDMGVRHAVLDVVARQAQLLGRVMKAARAEVRRAGLDSVRLDRLVTALQTAGDIAFRVTAPGATETLAAVPLRATQPPSALPATASVEQLCAGIITNAEGIRTAQPLAGGQLSSADCRRNATAAVVALHCACQAVAMLTRRHTELHPARELLVRRTLRLSAEGLHRVLDRWQAVRHRWQRLLFDQRRPGPADHLDQMTIRMGRLISANPEWTFELRNLPTLKSPAELAPTTADMSQILLSVRHAVEALAVLGHRDLAQVTAPGQIEAIHAMSRTTAAVNGQVGASGVRALVGAYRDVVGYTNSVLADLNRAALDTATPGERPSVMVALSILDRRRDPALVSALFDDTTVANSATASQYTANIRVATVGAVTAASRSNSDGGRQASKPTR